ncbi:DUF4384 domain-containing protein [Aquirufa sp. KTFRIE-69F]|uniref:DUF4384 domain-containing protein n=1 Tax=Aquirufa originis TaxID=3096514 RepID=A0ABW6D790_9BACT
MFQLKNKIAFLLFVSISFNLVSQKEVRLNNLSACAVLQQNQTIEEARKSAIFNVKLLALQEAGISEVITANQFFDVKKGSSSDKDEYYESTFADLKGEISKFTIRSFDQSVGETGEVNICVRADISVMKFDVEPLGKTNLLVEGLSSRYKNGDPIFVKISSPNPVYYWVFLIDGDGKYSLLYPFNNQQSNFIESNKIISLPEKSFNWNVTTSNKEGEKNGLLFVSYPQNVSISTQQITDFNSWASWYNQLDYTKRSKQIKNFLIF